MKILVHKAEDRGAGNYDWLTTRYSFSFGNWFEPSRMGFGTLRVINDDLVKPLTGFGPHGHNDMEIITIVTEGAVTHQDSMGNSGVVKAGEVQVMSAGTGVIHSEVNESTDSPLKLFQIWILPNKTGVEPRYAQKEFEKGSALLVAPDERAGALMINQDAFVTRALFDGSYTYTLHDATHGAYFFTISGEVQLGGQTLGARDAVGVTEAEKVELTAARASELLIFEVPMV